MLKIQRFAAKEPIVFALSERIETEKVTQLQSPNRKGAIVAIAAVLFISCAQVATVRNIEPRDPAPLAFPPAAFRQNEKQERIRKQLFLTTLKSVQRPGPISRAIHRMTALYRYITIPWAELHRCSSQRESYSAPGL
jgi:hypothetical protein